MARTTFSNKIALILGADTAVGRSCALQLSRAGARTILAGRDKARLTSLGELITSKGGTPSLVILARTAEDSMAPIREVRDALGHLHLVVNVLGAGEATADDEERPGRLAREYADALFTLVAGRGAVRFLTLLPDNQGAAPPVPPDAWHSLVRASAVQTTQDGGGDAEDCVKAAAIGDAVVYLLSCPPSACPAEVRLRAVSLKA